MRFLKLVKDNDSASKKEVTDAALAGNQAERLACEYLKKQGLRFLQKNYLSPLGEVDLIMRDKDNTFVFIEVRYRRNQSYGGGLESVTPHKQHCIKQTALIFLKQHKLYEKIPCRFDIIAVTFNSQKQDYEFEWIKDAF